MNSIRQPLSVTHPEVAALWDHERNTLTPDQVTAGSNKKVWWKCLRDSRHYYQRSVARRMKSELSSCSVCAGRVVLTGVNDLATLRPDLLSEWNYAKNDLDPTETLAGGHKKVWWKCKQGHEWLAAIKTRLKFGCKQCAWYGPQGPRKWKPLSETHPEVYAKIKSSDKNLNLDLADLSKGTRRKVWFKDVCGHEYQQIIANRTAFDGNCPVCSKQLVQPGVNDLYTLHPELMKEWSSKNLIDPKTIMPKSSTVKVWWVCKEGHEWQTSPSHRVSSDKTNCPYCAHKKVITGFNDLLSQYPEIAKEYSKNNEILSSEIHCQSGKRVIWQCTRDSNHYWKTKVRHRTVRGHNCPKCCTIHTSNVEQQFIKLLTQGFKGSRFIEESDSGFKHLMSLSRNKFRSIDGLLAYSKEFIAIDEEADWIDSIDKTYFLFVEYDGSYWHKDEASFERDTKKTKLILNGGLNYIVIRLREDPLPLLDMQHERLLQVQASPNDLDRAVIEIQDWLEQLPSAVDSPTPHDLESLVQARVLEQYPDGGENLDEGDYALMKYEIMEEIVEEYQDARNRDYSATLETNA